MPFINDVLEHNRSQSLQREPSIHYAGVGSRFIFDSEKVREDLLTNLVGQESVVDSLCQQLNIIKAGLANPRKPLLVMLMLGETGVGKTETIRLLAKCIHGDATSFCRIDMNTLSQNHYSAAITGAPPGYVGSKENTTLINEEAIKGSSSRPGIVLFDEIEKASSEVVRSLMNVFDNGTLRLASGTREISFSNCLIFMTSNLGSEQWSKLGEERKRWKSFWQFLKATDRRGCYETALQQHFDVEFLNRIDNIALYEPIGPTHIEKIVLLEIKSIMRMLSKKGIQLDVDGDVVTQIAQRGYDPRYGARSVQRAVRDVMLAPLAEVLLYSSSGSSTQNDISAKGDPGNVELTRDKTILTVSIVQGLVQCRALKTTP